MQERALNAAETPKAGMNDDQIKAIIKAMLDYIQRPTSFEGYVENLKTPAPAMSEMDGKALAQLIDHTLLKPEANEVQIRQLCREAREYGFASVCVNPYWVPTCAELLQGSEVLVCTVIGFPLGASTGLAKIFETENAVVFGAREVDMVINIGELKSEDYVDVLVDIQGVVKAAKSLPVKVIIETCLLTPEEKIRACVLAKEAGAHFVKTSTGFSSSGATEEDVALMRRVVGSDMGVKASGGIRDFKTAVNMIKAGANRLGASASLAIVRQEE
jgi:deoxyribose-phosphate aldolase